MTKARKQRVPSVHSEKIAVTTAVTTPVFVLWRKLHVKRARWERVGDAPTEAAATALMSGSGDFLVIEGNRHPTAGRRTKVKPAPSNGH
ncbi:hypothetical protein GobsT_71490 [Gemmata obscuriglobus]|nr:hypothetical protein GobsT_71490 [Gemmata obscuriglobus]VTS11652.1 unnamed protein product [Gemmata obscuriglobus UQM 2246]